MSKILFFQPTVDGCLTQLQEFSLNANSKGILSSENEFAAELKKKAGNSWNFVFLKGDTIRFSLRKSK